MFSARFILECFYVTWINVYLWMKTSFFPIGYLNSHYIICMFLSGASVVQQRFMRQKTKDGGSIHLSEWEGRLSKGFWDVSVTAIQFFPLLCWLCIGTFQPLLVKAELKKISSFPVFSDRHDAIGRWDLFCQGTAQTAVIFQQSESPQCSSSFHNCLLVGAMSAS